MVESPFSGRLRRLGVPACDLDDQDVAVLFGGTFPSLTDLSVGFNLIGEGAAQALAGNRSFSQLESLSVPRCGIGPSVAGLLGRVLLSGLRTLDAGQNPLGADGVRALCAGPLVSPVSHLDLEAAELGDSGAQAVAGSPALTNVRWLEMQNNHIGDLGAVALAESPHLTGVQSLNLSDNEIGPKGKDTLTRRFGDRVEVSRQKE